jgi:hypothetical protein
MSVVKRVRRLVNGRSRANPRAKAKGGRRRLSAKQLKFFGTKRQKAAAKAARTRKRVTAKPAPRRRVSAKSNPSPSRRRKPTAKRKVRRTSNPVPVLIALGAANPHKGTKGGRTMAKKRRSTRRKSTAGVRRRRTRRASNPTTRIVYRTRARRRTRRASNPGPVRRRRSVRGRRRNPAAFGAKVGSAGFMKAVAGVLAGVFVTKFIPTLIPAGMIQGGNTMRFVVSAGSALVAGMLAQKFSPGAFGDGAMLGAIAQAASVGLNTFLPQANFLALAGGRGMGVFQDSRFVVPQNPITGYIAPAPAAARVNVSGIQRAFATAF